MRAHRHALQRAHDCNDFHDSGRGMSLENRLLRAMNAIGQDAVAVAVGKDRTAINRINSGQQGVVLSDIEAFLRALGFKVVPAESFVVDAAKYELLLKLAADTLRRESEELREAR
jgi:hypothetical protein